MIGYDNEARSCSPGLICTRRRTEDVALQNTCYVGVVVSLGANNYTKLKDVHGPWS